MLKIKNAYKKFGNTVVFNDLNLEVPSQTILGLVGSSGGGKSTLLRCIQGLDHFDQGEVHYEGTCGLMFQDFQLFPHMNVLKNLTYAPSINDKSKKEDHIANAMNLLKTLGIGDKANHMPSQLSGGQKQRVALARILMMHPKLLLCDEPNSGLDHATTKDVIELLRTVRSMGVTMVIASHDLKFLNELADQVLTLKNGVLVSAPSI